MKLKTKNLWYEGKLTCKLCNHTFKHLGSHLWHKHQMLAKDYKMKFELPYREALISIDIYRKKKVHYAKHRKKYLKNLLAGGKSHQFKKGQSGERRISESERKRNIARINDLNKRKNGRLKSCVVCRVKFYHIESHLYTKHRLIKV